MGKSKKQTKAFTQTKESELLLKRYREDATALFKELNAPVLAKANDIEYRAFKRPYVGGGSDVLIILANGWYYPTPEVKLYFESTGTNEFKLMQNNSSAGFFLATYHSAQWTSGAGLINLGASITVEDAYGKHTVKVESL
ncbi:hypothetical protein [Kordia sp.]|uniref:hypothetical protein n=1 Tax=Kordia sp. TaxID=1965332 RepID=UPI003D6ACDB8